MGKYLAPKTIQYHAIEIKGWYAPSVEVQKFVLARVLKLEQYADSDPKEGIRDPEMRGTEWHSVTWLGFGESLDHNEPGAVAVATTNDSGGADYLYFWSYTDSMGETYLAERWSDGNLLEGERDVAHYVLSEEGEDTVEESVLDDYVPFSPHTRNYQHPQED